jgi:hypothetical protein
MKSTKFYTNVDIPKLNWETGYSKTNMFLGSCFTENVGNRLRDLKFKVDINPFGILYNPVSVANGLQILLQKKKFEPEDLVFHNGLWHSFSHHGRFSFPTAEESLDAINSRIERSYEFLKKADFLFITFGTAWIYKLKKSGQPVSNCHKIPATEFERKRLSVSDIVSVYIELLAEIKRINPGIKIVFTISPIRHWKDGAIENQRSKATLLLAVDEIIRKSNNDFCAYFPAYEIVMDELRDYRFYADDMIHISDVAVNYIWEKFVSYIVEDKSREIALEIEKIVKAKEHKPSGRNLSEYKKFVVKVLQQINMIEKKFGYIDLKEEQQYFTIKLNG